MRAKTIAALAAAALVAWGATTEGRPGRRGPGMRQGRKPPVELTDEQQEKMKTLRLQQAKELSQLKADLQVAQVELQSALGAEDATESSVKAQIAAVNKARSAIFSKQTDFRAKLGSVLTAEQREKMQTMRKGRPGRGRQGMAMRPGHRGCGGPGKAMRRGRGGRGGHRGQAVRGRGRRGGHGPRDLGGMRPGGKGHGPQAMADALDLTDAQQEKMKALRLQNAKAMAQLKADQKIAQMELAEAMRGADPAAAGTRARVAAVSKARSKIFEQQTLNRLRMQQVLTPVQRGKARKLREARPRRGTRGAPGMHGRRGRMGMGGRTCPFGCGAGPAPAPEAHPE